MWMRLIISINLLMLVSLSHAGENEDICLTNKAEVLKMSTSLKPKVVSLWYKNLEKTNHLRLPYQHILIENTDLFELIKILDNNFSRDTQFCFDSFNQYYQSAVLKIEFSKMNKIEFQRGKIQFQNKKFFWNGKEAVLKDVGAIDKKGTLYEKIIPYQ